MAMRELAWLIFLVWLPFSNGLMPSLTVWNAHTTWAQGWVVGIWAMGWQSRQRLPSCLPLGLLVGWMVGMTWWRSTELLLHNQAPSLELYVPLIHVVVMSLFIQAAISQWTREFLPRLLRGMAWAAVAMSGYCALQLLGMDQFMRELHGRPEIFLVGTIGNPSHLASYLAFALPLVLLQPEWWWKVFAGWMGVVLLCTGSLAGQLAATLSLLVVYATNRWVRWSVLVGVVCGGVWLWFHPWLLNSHGRFLAWQEFYRIFSERPITGFGQGFTFFLATMTQEGPIKNWGHVHNEVFQVALENGVVGVGLVLATLTLWVRRACQVWHTKLGRSLIAVMGAFGLNAMLNFPAHLWALGMFGLVAFCGVMILTETPDGTQNL
jgi:hypothetical protein